MQHEYFLDRSSASKEQRIRERAYFSWLNSGKAPESNHAADWDAAEAVENRVPASSCHHWHFSQISLVTAGGVPVSGPGILFLTPLGAVELTVCVNGRFRLSDFPLEQPITAVTEDGLNLGGGNAFLRRCSFDSSSNKSTLSFVATHFELRKPKGGGVVRQEVYFKAIGTLGPAHFTDTQCKFALRSISVGPENPGNISAVLEIDSHHPFDHIQVLLGMAQRCKARAPFRVAFDNYEAVAFTLMGDDAPIHAGYPLIPPRGSDLSSFMNQSLATYSKVASDLNLPALVDYYCLSVAETFAELKFILASVFMEALKFHWARNIANYPVDQKANKLIRGFVKNVAPSGKKNFYTFEELIVNTYQHYGLSPAFSFIDDRNTLFHTGVPGATQLGGPGSTWAAIRPELEILYRQMDDFLLTVLGYSGPVRRWEHPDDDVAFP